MKKSIGLTALLLAMTLGVNATAQEEAAAPEAVEAQEPVDCDSFIITPPAGWIRVAGLLSDTEMARLPDNIRDHYTRPTSDVIFIDIKSPDEKDTKNFKNSLNIVSIGEQIPLNEKLVDELTTVLKSQYDSMFENFKFESAEIEKINDNDVLVVKGSYGVLNYSVNMEQILYPTSKDTYVLTCSYDAQGEDPAKVAASCRKAVETLEVK